METAMLLYNGEKWYCSVDGFTSFGWHVHATILQPSIHPPVYCYTDTLLCRYRYLHQHCFIFLSLSQLVYLSVRNTCKFSDRWLADICIAPNLLWWNYLLQCAETGMLCYRATFSIFTARKHDVRFPDCKGEERKKGGKRKNVGRSSHWWKTIWF